MSETLAELYRKGNREPTQTWGVTRITAEEFATLPEVRPIGIHVRWKTKIDGRWVLRYSGTSCGVPFQTAEKIVVTVPAA